MPVALPGIFFLLVWMGAAARGGFREGFVTATIVCTLVVVGATELLSLLGWLRFPAVLCVWIGATAIAAYWLWRRGDRSALSERAHRLGAAWRSRWPELASTVGVLGAVLLVGVLSPPNNWESLSYRLMRVVMWLQQGSVEHYPTAMFGQLYYAPLGSYTIAHLQLLAEGDRFAAVPEWLALVGCTVAASLIARQFKQPFSVQVLAAVLAATLPGGLLQGSSTQANLAAAYWLLCFVLLLVGHLHRPSAWKLLGCGCAAGFAVMAKPIAYVVLPPVAVALTLYGVVALRKVRRTVLALAAAAALAVVLNLGHYARNWALAGHPVSPSGEANHLVQTVNLNSLWANLLRNSLLHTSLLSPDLNASLLSAVSTVVGRIRDPPGASMMKFSEHGIPYRFTEELTPNPLHFLLLAAAAAALCSWRFRNRRLRGTAVPLTTTMLGGWLAAVLLFCALLMYERWNGRYHVMLFMLGAPLAAAFLRGCLPGASAVGPSRPEAPVEWPLRAASGVFLLASIPWLLFKESAPVLRPDFGYPVLKAEPILAASREQAYYNNIGGGHFYRASAELADQVVALEAQEVGLILHWLDYPLAYAWYALLRERIEGVHIGYYGRPHNASALLYDAAYKPDVVIRSHRLSPEEVEGYGVVWSDPDAGTVLRRLPENGLIERRDTPT